MRATSRRFAKRIPIAAVLTCHDEYLLASMVQGVDGGLLGFASFIPELILELVNAVQAGDLNARWIARRASTR